MRKLIFVFKRFFSSKRYSKVEAMKTAAKNMNKLHPEWKTHFISGFLLRHNTASIVKRITFILFVFAGLIQAQVYDNPIDSTNHYTLRLYAQGAHVPNNVLNDDKKTIDSVMYSLIVWVDSLQFQLVADTNIAPSNQLVLKISNYATGSRQFTTTSQIDSFTVSKTVSETTDVFLLTPYGATISSNDVLSYTCSGTKVYVHRPASGTSALKYKWRWIRRH